MGMAEDTTTMQELLARLAELERANTRMSEQLAAMQREPANPAKQKMSSRRVSIPKKPTESQKHKSRRSLLEKGLGVAAATIGAGALVEISGGTAHANGTESPTTFDNGGVTIPAVTAHSGTPSSTPTNAIMATSDGYTGIAGFTNNPDLGSAGVFGSGPYVGVTGFVQGANTIPIVKVGVYGSGSNRQGLGWVGVEGESDTSYGVVGISYGTTPSSGGGVGGFTANLSDIYAVGVEADGARGFGVHSLAVDPSGWGLAAYGDPNDPGIGVGVRASGRTGVLATGTVNAGEFDGNVLITGALSKPGGTFKIDHPLDPANKYLSHSFVESPDMKNVYDGVVMLDTHGAAVVQLPAWFGVLNKEFRYQLTAIGAAGPNLHIAEEISNQRFKIAGGVSGMKVCWQVTGIRQDAWAQAHPVIVEQDKTASERGLYLHPELYGHSSDKSAMLAPYGNKLKRVSSRKRFVQSH